MSSQQVAWQKHLDQKTNDLFDWKIYIPTISHHQQLSGITHSHIYTINFIIHHQLKHQL